MAAEVASPGGADFFFKGESGRNTRGLLRLIILCTIAAAAVASRLFSVIRFESIIHECMYQLLLCHCLPTLAIQRNNHLLTSH
jgi:hypothetical protein